MPTAHPLQTAPRAQRQAGVSPDPRPVEAEEEAGFGWLASSLELKLGLLVQYLRIDPTEPQWREVFAG